MLQPQPPDPSPGLPPVPQQAFDALFAELSEQLRRKASILCRNERSPSFATGDLLSELYLRLQKNPAYALTIAAQGRLQFLAMAAQAMRNILTDAARSRRQRASFAFVTLSHADQRKAARYSPEDVICVDELIRALQPTHPRRAAIVQMRFYGGFTIPELKQFWGLADSTIEKDIQSALKVLHGILNPEK